MILLVSLTVVDGRAWPCRSAEILPQHWIGGLLASGNVREGDSPWQKTLPWAARSPVFPGWREESGGMRSRRSALIWLVKRGTSDSIGFALTRPLCIFSRTCCNADLESRGSTSILGRRPEMRDHKPKKSFLASR